jgi:hypothetical protein
MSTTRAVLTPLGPTARLLSVPATWLRAEADAGRLPHLRAGSSYLFDVDTIERLLLERARQGCQDKKEDGNSGQAVPHE